MSYGKMNNFIDIAQPVISKDSEGFKIETDNVLASVKAYREGRHGNEKWANRSSFSEATDLFRFRYIPSLNLTTSMVIIQGDRRFEITSMENVKGRGMYMEVLAKEVIPSG